MLTGVRVNPEMMRQSALRGYATATDLADYLTKKGIPFRDAHEIVAKTVQFAEQKNCDLSDLELSELQIFSTHIEADIFAVLTLEGSMQNRKHTGGTAPEQVQAAIHQARQRLS
jgi:argininosuccinate lyase